MVGIDLVVGYLVAWAWIKARRVAGQVDADVDDILDASVERLHRAVAAKLGDDRALRQLEVEAASNLEAPAVASRTRTRVQLALEDAAEGDGSFAAELKDLLAQIRSAGGQRLVSGSSGGVTAGGDVNVSATDHSAAAGVIKGNVSVGSSHQDQPEPDPGNPRISADSSVFAQQGSFAAYRIDQVVLGDSRTSDERQADPVTRRRYFTDFEVVKTVEDVGRLCEAHAAVLLFTQKAEPGAGAANAESRFRRDRYPQVKELVGQRDIAICFANVGSLYTNFFTDNSNSNSIGYFLKRRRARFVGCHLFVGDQLVGSKRVNEYSLPLDKAPKTFLEAAEILLRENL